MKYFSSWSIFKTIAFICIFKAFLSSAISLIAQYFLPKSSFNNASLEGFESYELFLIVVVLAPLIETFLFQYLVIELILWAFSYLKIEYGEIVALIISTILFCITHNFSYFYLFNSFISGFIYSITYIIAKNKKDMNPFWTVFIIHSFSNLTTFVLNLIFD